MPRNEKGSPFQTWTLIVILIATSAFAFTGGQLTTVGSEAPARELADVQSDSAFQYESHAATAEDIEMLKAEFGVRDPQKNYNVLYDGFGTGLAPPTEAEWQGMVGITHVDDVNEPMLEPMVDHSQEPYFPRVRSQQSQGSCSAWSVAYYINGYNQAKDMNWTDASTGNNDHLMSPAFVYNKANSGFDSGSWPSGNMEVIKTVGNSIWTEMPYNQNDPISWGDEGAWRSAPQFRGLDYQITDPSNTDVLRAWVAEGYAVSIVLDAGNYGLGLGDGDDIINSTEHSTGNPNHANTIVGYNDSREDDGEIGAFKIVNSWGIGWGSAWGGNGYYWMTYEAADELPNIALRFRDIENYEPSLLGIVNLNPQGGRNAPVTLGIGTVDDPAATRSPWWRGADHDFPAFMALDYTDFKNEWRTGQTQFFLDIGAGTGYSTITSFKIELYESGYSPTVYTRVSDESPDTPQDTPGTVTVSFYPSMRMLNPLDGDNINGLVNISGTATNPVWTVVLREDFEGSWPGTWVVGDSTGSEGDDYWGLTNARYYAGATSAWSAAVGDYHEISMAQDFDNGGLMPANWITLGVGPDSHPWDMVLESGSDYIAECSSSDAGVGTEITEWLQMDSGFDASSQSSLNLSFYMDYQEGDGDDYASVLYSTSANYPAFTALNTWTTTTQGVQIVDLSAATGDPSVYLAFLYHGTYDQYMRVDDVEVIGGVPNDNRQQYDNDMDAYMEHDVDLSGHDSATLAYNYWLDSESGVDFVYAMYYDGTWNYVDSHTGDSGGWQGSEVLIPTTATKIGFHFHSDSSGTAEGAYIDDVLLLGHGNIDEVYVKVDDSSWTLATGTASWFYEWDTSSLQEGWHTVYARAYYGAEFTEDSARVTIDDTLPINPDSYTSSHTPTEWSNDNTVWIRWFGAWDNVSGIGGFAVAWTMSPISVPAPSLDTTEMETTSYALPDSNSWYVHIRTVDKAGHWAVGAYHVGPFYIDTSPPTNPNAYSSDHSIFTWSSDDTIFIEWSGASDTMSGVFGYSYTWTTVPDTLPITFISSVFTNTTSFPLGPSDNWYFHVRARDNAQNWATTAYHVGPFYIDVEDPWTTHTFTGTPGDFGWFISDVNMVLTPADNHSGVDQTTFRVNGGPWTGYFSPQNFIVDGNYMIEYYSVDNVGNFEMTNVGNFDRDATAPLNPDDFSSSHAVGTWSPDDTIDASWTGASDATSGVYGYSFDWTQSPATLPDATVDSTSPSTTSPQLGTGNDWYLHVRTRDVAGNWAPTAYHVGPFCIDVSPPIALDDIWAVLEGAGWQDVNITWTFATDPESGVLRYDVYYGTSYDPTGTGYVLLSSVPADTDYLVHVGGGDGDFSNYFYQIRAVDQANNSAPFATQAGKYVKNLAPGWKLLSIPLEQKDDSVGAVLKTLDFVTARYYYAGSWKSYSTQKNYCTLEQIGTNMGIWVDVAGGSNLTVAGRVPTTTLVNLAKGWNLVGFPSFGTSYTIADLKSDSGAVSVEIFNGFSPPHFLRTANDIETMTAGNGYWIEVSMSGTWTIMNEPGNPQDPKDTSGDEGIKSLPPGDWDEGVTEPDRAPRTIDAGILEVPGVLFALALLGFLSPLGAVLYRKRR
jgi:hypothetical protein